MAGVASKGTLFKVGTVSVGQLTKIGGIKLKADSTDVTDLGNSTGYREFIGGFKDGGEVGLSGFFAGLGEAGQKALYDAFENGTATSMSIVFPTAISASWAFDGVVIGYETDVSVEDAIGFDCTVKVSGKPTLTATTV